jgi:hypothetical protein
MGFPGIMVSWEAERKEWTFKTAPRINERSVSLSYWWRKESRK